MAISALTGGCYDLGLEGEAMRQPVAVCEVCGHHQSSPSRINERCSQVYDGRRCRGVYGSRLAVDDWIACASCSGTGLIDRQQCRACEGDGMVDNRRRVR